jgi:hypothetical protein
MKPKTLAEITIACALSMAGCSRSEIPHYVLTPLSEGIWVRLDTVTGDMLECGRHITPPNVPAPPPGYVVEGSGIVCDPVTPGKVVNWNDLK